LSKTGRNDPCPCGSGKKFKFCHGAVQLQPALAAPTSSAGTARSCGPCTACCEGWAEGEIRGHRMHPGQACHFLRPAAARSAQASPCAIYEERPQSPCRNFVCGWLAKGSSLPDAFRPDLCGVIVVPTRWRDTPAWILLSAGRDPSQELLAWMQRHAMASGQPFFYADKGERLGFGPPQFQQDMLDKLQRGEKLW
jgi:SEC-C motif